MSLEAYLPVDNLPLLVLMLLLGVGVAFLYYGGSWLTDGSVAMADRLRVNPVVICLTVVSAATSMPELLTSFYSVARGAPGLAVGNIIGSNLCNIGLILGLAAWMVPFRVQARLIRAEAPLLVILTGLFAVFCWGGIARWEGAVLLLGFLGYMGFVVRGSRQLTPAEMESLQVVPGKPLVGTWRIGILVAVGTLAMTVGADFLVTGAIEITKRLGVGEVVIGLTVVAVGTSLPELAATLVAASRKQHEIVAGNIVGSCILNILLIAGGVAIFHPIAVERSLFSFEFPVLFLLTAILWGFFYTGRILSRKEGVVLLAIYMVALSLAIWID